MFVIIQCVPKYCHNLIDWQTDREQVRNRNLAAERNYSKDFCRSKTEMFFKTN